jgi:hypothetical protein
MAERHGTLVQENCDADDIAQRFTPWDFAIVRTPRNHCLGVKDGVPVLAPCGALTTDYRWASTPLSQWADLREAGAMYGDVTGDGKPSAVYVQRRGDGPGFDVQVATLAPGAHAATWYRNAVLFDSHAIVPTCRGDTLCFDSTRFVLGDFDGTGRASLMAIAPTDDGGTAFWLLRSTGSAFAAPRLWYKTTPSLAPARTQQYVAGDFNGDGRTDIMAAARTGDDRGFDLWVLTSRGATANAPTLWRAAQPLAPATRLFAARLDSSPRAGLVAVEDSDGALAVATLASSGRVFVPAAHTARFPALRAAWAKVAVGAIDARHAIGHANRHSHIHFNGDPDGRDDGNGPDGLVVLTQREPSATSRANIDVWTIALNGRLGSLTHAGAIGDMGWSDVLPGLVTYRDAAGRPQAMLALYERMNATLDEYHLTGGAPALAGYPLTEPSPQLGPQLGLPERFGALPGRYSETLRLDRLQ